MGVDWSCCPVCSSVITGDLRIQLAPGCHVFPVDGYKSLACSVISAGSAVMQSGLHLGSTHGQGGDSLEPFLVSSSR